jgi:amidase
MIRRSKDLETNIENLHFLEITEVAKLVHSRQVSPVEMTAAMIRRAETVDSRLHAFVRVLAESAMESARVAEREIASGHIRSPLHGVPVAVKDMFWIRGVPTAAGMSIHQDFVSDVDATVIRRLREGGAILLGQLVLTQGVHAEHLPPYRAPISPWSPGHWSGASSSGSGVAVAAGLCFGALSSETGGSTRLPAAVNGITAIKPTWGRVSRYGVFDLAGSLDHVGAMARSAADAAAMLGVIAGCDDDDLTAAREPVPNYTASLNDGIRGLRIGVDEAWTHSDVDSETTRALDRAIAVLEGVGAIIKPIAIPDTSAIIWDWGGICAVEAALAHEATFPTKAAEYGPALTALLNLGHSISGIEHQRLLKRRGEFSRALQLLFDQVDVLAMPVLAFLPPTLERMARMDDELIRGVHRFTCPFNMSGNPAIVLPCGISNENMPLVFQLVGPRFGEGRLFTAGHAFQRSTEWHRRHPVD